ncbi:hypothetical protein GQ43DRAFT_430741 [Delitschia confertaspora ATCC 74209]|uniref:Uncharacterized protein n=1 Tax=Delitschia confertaspora ATCC 74209 TaxID=1513339 RepID=A0A9P4MR14_9PLEO|nr:hypothetical protein GQ43DRAFT_430741 [Delitschia confertaspora ATCC 74209]
MGNAYREAEIIGNDPSPLQPSWVPANVKFEVDDCESQWTYNKPFNFIFCRYMVASVADWARLFGQAYENITPGGFVEFQGFDLRLYSKDSSLTKSSTTWKYCTLLIESSRKLGREACPGPRLEGWMTEAGFENVVHPTFQIPIGPWPKDKQKFLQEVEAFSMRLLTTTLQWTSDEVQTLCAKVQSELKSS